MAELTRTQITGALFKPDGSKLTNAYVRFVMSGFDTDAPEGATVVNVPVDMEIDSESEIDGLLWPNPDGVRFTYYTVSVGIRNAYAADTMRNLALVEVPSTGGPYDLNDLLQVSPSNTTGATLQQLLDAKANIITGYSDDYDVILTGADGFGGAAFGENKADLGPLSIEITDAGRFMVMGADKFIIGELAYLSDTDADPEAALSAAAVVPYVGENIYAVEGEVFDLFAAGMLADRGNVDKVRFSLQSGQGYSVAGTEVLRVDADSLGDTAYIQARRLNDTGGTFPEIIMDCYTATKSPVSGASPTIISIGDSITYRSGTAWAGWYLDQWGYTPSFVGTLLSLEETLDGDTAARQDDEGRPGHTLQDMTYDVTTRVSPVTSGDEAAYLALGVTDRRLKNPFLRLSTGSDDAEDIYNGYVVDFAYYVSRFSFAAPDVLWHGYGTNDIRDVPYDELEDKIFELDSLIYRRWHLDYPTKPVVRFLPGTNWETDRNEVWNSGYIPAIRGMMRAAKAATGPVLLIPTWAMHTADGGYDLERVDAPDAVTGATMRTLEDLHPTGATRRGLFKAVAAGLACASTNNYGA